MGDDEALHAPEFNVSRDAIECLALIVEIAAGLFHPLIHLHVVGLAAGAQYRRLIL
jgi:hypothetical protein